MDIGDLDLQGILDAYKMEEMKAISEHQTHIFKEANLTMNEN